MSLFGVETGVPLIHHAFGTELLGIRNHNAELFRFQWCPHKVIFKDLWFKFMSSYEPEN